MLHRFGIVIIIATALLLGPRVAGAHMEAPVIPIVFPVTGSYQYSDTFGAPRSGGRSHAGADILADKGTGVRAVTTGNIAFMNESGLGGYSLILDGDDGNRFYYAHLNNDSPGTDDGQGGVEAAYAPELHVGKRVLAGEIIAYVGDSGNAEGTAPHLHFEIWPQGGPAICPQPSLEMAISPEAPVAIMEYAGFEGVWATPTPFSPNFDGVEDTSSFAYTLSRPALVTIEVFNYQGLVRTVIDAQAREAGRYYEGWTGTNDNGNVLVSGNYRYIITAQDSATGLISTATAIVSIAP